MSNRKLAKATQGLSRSIQRLQRSLSKTLVNWILRSTLIHQRKGQVSTAGFVLPTTVLLILIITLTVGALTYRAYTRNTQAIGDAQQRVIYNAATPAIDRARAKIEFLFDSTRELRYPGGVPGGEVLYNMMVNDGTGIAKLSLKDKANNVINPYDLPNETRLDLNGDGRKDNAWAYDTDVNGSRATVVYSIAFRTPAIPTNSNKSIDELLLTTKDADKAKVQIVRHGPLSNNLRAVGCAANPKGTGPDSEWFEDTTNTSILRKNFQVDAIVIPHDGKSTAVTLELHQDRQINRGNKWGAWFRNDLEIHPGASFNWNGAMHTEGSLILGGDKFTAHLISAPKSCVFNPPSNSEITVTKFVDPKTGALKFNGIPITGWTKDDSLNGNITVYLHSADPTQTKSVFNKDTDGALDGATPSQISINPEKIVTEDGYENRLGKNNSTFDNWKKLGGSSPTELGARIKNVAEVAPYVDDLYRADNRWGPKYKYDNNGNGSVPDGMFGKEIVGGDYSRLTLLEPPSDEDSVEAAVGLDGYWERRARSKGLRILVGERLELGDLNTWYPVQDTNGDGFINSNGGEVDANPLYPPTLSPYPIANATETVRHIDLQRRSIRDNLAAVQGTAIYHHAVNTDKDYPVACFATTAHPGTPTTLRQSINFMATKFKKGGDGDANEFLLSNFFTGRGTNGWEFEPPASNAAAFEAAMNNADSPLRKALTNLANFAGDPDGAFPPKPDDPTYTHPYPAFTMWGNFSNLRRTLTELKNGKAYKDLSIADKTYLQTAACTLGILAYNINEIQQFDPSNVKNDDIVTASLKLPFNGSSEKRVLTDLASKLLILMNGDVKDGEVLPPSQLSTYNKQANGTFDSTKHNARDYDGVPPEAFIGALKQMIAGAGGEVDEVDNDPRVRMAEMIMLNHQIRRDRTFGFQASPAFGEYVIDMFSLTNKEIYPTACDPDQFTFGPGVPLGNNLYKQQTVNFAEKSVSQSVAATPSTTLQGTRDNTLAPHETYLAAYRLALSKLCGTIAVPPNYAPATTAGTPETVRVLPKFPSLYYLFPEVEHDLIGSPAKSPGVSYNQKQPDTNEPYLKDAYIKKISTDQATLFKPVDSIVPGQPGTLRSQFPSPKYTDPILSIADLKGKSGTRPFFNSTSTGAPMPFPVADRSVKAIAIKPREVASDLDPAGNEAWQLPKQTSVSQFYLSKTQGPSSIAPNQPTNYILAPSNKTAPDTATNLIAVPFLDRAFFDGRQYLLTRTLDIDLGMLKDARAGSNNVWLPKSGVVYAFREDAVREDAIQRPADDQGMNLTRLTTPKDPKVKSENHGISTKAIDFLPDPDRRSHGFRLRNGAQIKRKDGLLNVADNVRGLSFFTDQPVYIQGDFNLHQDGSDNTTGTRLEEFTTTLPDTRPYTPDEFYKNRTTINDNFAKATTDRWRPSEILADSISLISEDFCDGSVADSFVLPTKGSGGTDFVASSTQATLNSDRSVYNKFGLYGLGCRTGKNVRTSFNNQNRPKVNLPTNATWVREVSSPRLVPEAAANYWLDFTSPIKISRAGQPLVTTAPNTIRSYNDSSSVKGVYYGVEEDNDGNRLTTPSPIRVNSIIVSGIHPSRKYQGYGGLQNFPRFLENWGGQNVFFAGSFLQLNFSNYATAPFETERWEPGTAEVTTESIPYYSPPQRLWGYDVALQLNPAGPAAARFVIAGKNRSEFYSEPPADDPYMNKLCATAKATPGVFPNPAKVNCPS